MRVLERLTQGHSQLAAEPEVEARESGSGIHALNPYTVLSGYKEFQAFMARNDLFSASDSIDRSCL